MIFIIIPVFNRKEFTRNCLKSLNNQTFTEYKVIVVDDGSTDGTSQMIASEFPMVHVVLGDGNLWWAGATNAGVEHVLKSETVKDSDYILTLNNDLEVDDDYLEKLFSAASQHPKAIIGSVSVDIANTQKMNYCGVMWNQFTGRYHLKAKDYNYSYKKLLSDGNSIDSKVLSGRGTLIPIIVFEEIGLYDAVNFPQYAADDDFSLRAYRKGWKLIIPTNTFVKSHINEMGADVDNVQISLKYFKHLFFSIKSPLNLKVRYRWAIKNTKLKALYFVLDATKILLSFSFKSFKKILKASFNF